MGTRSGGGPFSEDGFADFNGDGAVGVPDLLALLLDWGTGGSEADLNVDGTVNTVDLLILFEFWG